MTRKEISETACRNQCISYLEKMIPKYEKGWPGASNYKQNLNSLKKELAALKDGGPATCMGLLWPTFARLTPGKGILRILAEIRDLNGKGEKPSGRQLNTLLELKYGLTGNNNDTYAGIRRAKMIKESRGFELTEFGKSVLESYGC